MAISRAKLLLQTQRWDFHESGSQAAVRNCPLCSNSNSKFYINISGEANDGLWDCKVCGEHGNFGQLKQRLGLGMENVVSAKDMAGNGEPQPLPDFNALHNNLMNNPEYGDVLDYLVAERKFSLEVIEKFKIGAWTKDGSQWYVIPYFDGTGNGIYYKSRRFGAVPDKGSRFNSPHGREVGLFNESCIVPDMEVLYIVEGEPDALSMLSSGYDNVVAVPGAGVKKAAWIDKLDHLAPKTIYIIFDNDKPGQSGAHELALRIGLDKVKNVLLPDFGGKDVNDWFKMGHSKEALDILIEDSRFFDVQGVQALPELLNELRVEIETKGTDPTYDTPWPSLTKRMGGVEAGDLVGLLAGAKIGKMQPLSSLVLTPTGWTTMGSLVPGQKVASIDGELSEVTGVFPHGKQQVYKVTFSDGRATRCGADHLWKVGNSSRFSRDGYQVVNTLDLRTMVENDDRWFVPLFGGEFEVVNELPISPWLLGALIGDGGFTGGGCRFTKTDKLTVEAVRRECHKYGWELTSVDGVSYNIVNTGEGDYISIHLIDLGLYGRKSIDKHIPAEYMESSRESRLALLRGLMDTDGSVEGKYKVPCFNTSSKRLAEDVQRLVWSLGGTATIETRIPHYTYKGVYKEGHEAYRLLVKLNDSVFLYSHKKDKECTRSRQFRLTIVGVEPDGVEECQCISVSHPSKLYVTDDYVVTHNTTMALNWLQYYADNGIDSLMFCQEMQPRRMVRKWVSMVTNTPDTPGSSKITVETIDSAMEYARNMPGDLLFGYTKSCRVDDVVDTIRQTVRRYGVKIVCFDNLQMLVRSLEHAPNEISSITKKFKALCMEMNIAMILIIQPHRVPDGVIPSARNAMGSSSPEKDVDTMVCMHRNRVAVITKESDFKGFMESEDNFDPQLLVRVDLSRYAPGGQTTLYMEGATSKVRELTDGDMTGASTGFTGVIPTEATRESI